MDQRALLLKFWDAESKTTRNVLARIPEGSTYRPDPKSRTAREIAWLIVREQRVLVEGLIEGRLEWHDTPAPDSMREILESFDGLLADMTSRLTALDHAHWDRKIPFVF